MAILSFADEAAEEFFTQGRLSKGVPWADIRKIVARKLDMLHYARALVDLKAPPANRLEALKGDWRGYFSIRINDQWRIIFKWTTAGPAEVRIDDYH